MFVTPLRATKLRPPSSANTPDPVMVARLSFRPTSTPAPVSRPCTVEPAPSRISVVASIAMEVSSGRSRIAPASTSNTPPVSAEAERLVRTPSARLTVWPVCTASEPWFVTVCPAVRAFVPDRLQVPPAPITYDPKPLNLSATPPESVPAPPSPVMAPTPPATSSHAAAALRHTDKRRARLGDQRVGRRPELHGHAADPLDRAIIRDRRRARGAGVDADRARRSGLWHNGGPRRSATDAVAGQIHTPLPSMRRCAVRRYFELPPAPPKIVPVIQRGFRHRSMITPKPPPIPRSVAAIRTRFRPRRRLPGR